MDTLRLRIEFKALVDYFEHERELSTYSAITVMGLTLATMLKTRSANERYAFIGLLSSQLEDYREEEEGE